MARPLALATGWWADLSLNTLTAKLGSWAYDGLEVACRTIGNHLAGHAAPDVIHERHRAAWTASTVPRRRQGS
ncbi:MAG TPA: hypothetical protein VLH79_04860 [Chthonomonadales bacterium]|nr:hypothetical protein [Chthonomonadales bacterium]